MLATCVLIEDEITSRFLQEWQRQGAAGGLRGGMFVIGTVLFRDAVKKRFGHMTPSSNHARVDLATPITGRARCPWISFVCPPRCSEVGQRTSSAVDVILSSGELLRDLVIVVTSDANV